MKLILVSVALSALAGACGDGGSDAADAAPELDARPIERTRRAYVLTRTLLPTNQDEVADASFDYPGTDFPVNKMGGLTTVLLDLVPELDVQGNVDGGIQSGEVLGLWVIESGPLDEDDPAPTAYFAQAVDADADPTNTLTGTGQVRLAPGEQLVPIITDATLSGGMLVGHGDADTQYSFRLKLLPDTDPYDTWGYYGHLRVAITEAGFTGQASSAATPEDLHTYVYPGIADVLTRAIEQDVARATEIRGIFDDNSDDTVTVQELIDNDTMASLTQPDVDLDEDGVNDHVSQGSTIEAVAVELVE
jgi:hypothetical protein